MILSDSGRNLLVQREGLRTKAYKDTKGIWTIGVGDTDMNNDGVRDVTETTEITKDQAILNFLLDVKWAEDCVNDNVKVPLTQNQFDALVSFVFNVGETAFRKSTLLRKLNAGSAMVAEEFDRWCIPASIIGRRMQEKKQFLS